MFFDQEGPRRIVIKTKQSPGQPPKSVAEGNVEVIAPFGSYYTLNRSKVLTDETYTIAITPTPGKCLS